MYCGMCFQDQHRKGKRAKHTARVLEHAPTNAMQQLSLDGDAASHSPAATSSAAGGSAKGLGIVEAKAGDEALAARPRPERLSPEWFLDRAAYIPLRLEMKERFYVCLGGEGWLCGVS